jgi:uncharacterized membrane protein (DUF4010 family)
MQFVLISCVILPVLPNKDFYLGVLNPRETWFMVVLIVAMSLGGYIAYKFLGRDAGILLGGIMGGAISSTATTVSYSRQTRSTAADAGSAAVVIMIASTMVFLRVLIEVSVVAPVFLGRLAAPILVMMTLMLLPSTAMWYRIRRRPSLMPQQHNPTQLTSALWFGAMYALVLLALAWIKQHVGDQWLYSVAAFSGLTDMDAITLSTARMFRSASADSWIASEGWKLVLTAALSNLAFKTLMVGLLGTRTLLCQVALLYSIPFFAGLAILFLW